MLLPWAFILFSGAIQGPSDRLVVELAMARQLGITYFGRKTALEDIPQEFATPHEPTGPARASYRTPDHMRELARVAGATLVRPGSARLCEDTPKPGCVDVFLRIGVPEIRGDSAWVWVYTYQDLKQDWMLAAADDRWLLVKRDGRWTAEKAVEFHESLLRRVPAEAGAASDRSTGGPKPWDGSPIASPIQTRVRPGTRRRGWSV